MAKNSTTSESNKQEPIFTSEKSNLISVMQMERTVIGYGITEDELDHVSNLNTNATTFVSVATALFVSAGGMVANWLMGAQPDSWGIILAYCVAPILGGLGAVFIFLARKAGHTRATIVDRIKTQSRLIQ